MQIKAIKQFISYGIIGICTTAINYLIYYFTLHLQTHYLVANSLAWMGAVIFAFYTNKYIVFQSQQDAKQEAVLFISMRLVTLVIENILLGISISLLHINPLLAKLLVSVITVIANYGFCKSKIFKQKEGIQYEQN